MVHTGKPVGMSSLLEIWSFKHQYGELGGGLVFSIAMSGFPGEITSPFLLLASPFPMNCHIITETQIPCLCQYSRCCHYTVLKNSCWNLNAIMATSRKKYTSMGLSPLWRLNDGAQATVSLWPTSVRDEAMQRLVAWPWLLFPNSLSGS